MSTPTLTPDELITEISQLSVNNKIWFMVEGNSDILFFQGQLLHYEITYEDCNGWANVIEILSKWNNLSPEKRKNKSIIGIIDKDYHLLINTLIPDNVILVDERDIEITMFECDEALNKVLIELGHKDKLPLLEGQKINLNVVRNSIYMQAYPLEKIRLLNALKRKEISFKKPFCFDSCITLKPFNLNIEKLVTMIANHNNYKFPPQELKALIDEEIDKELIDYKKISNGHDIMTILGLSLKKHYGLNNSKEVDGDQIEKKFRLAYPHHNFCQSKWGSNIMNILKNNQKTLLKP